MVKEEAKRKWLNLLQIKKGCCCEVLEWGGKWGEGSSLPNERSSTGFRVCQSIRLLRWDPLLRLNKAL